MKKILDQLLQGQCPLGSFDEEALLESEKEDKGLFNGHVCLRPAECMRSKTLPSETHFHDCPSIDTRAPSYVKCIVFREWFWNQVAKEAAKNEH